MFAASRAIQLSLCTLLVVPAVGLQDGARSGLTRALEDTVSVLEELLDVGSALERGDTSAIDRILRATEPPSGDDQECDGRLCALRDEVSRLHLFVDELRAGKAAAAAPPASGGPIQPGEPVDSGEPGAAAGAVRTTGLDEAQRSAIAERSAASLPGPVTQRKALEPAGYSASALREAQLLLKAGRPAEALRALERTLAGHEASYLRARAFEKLGRLEDALAEYRAVGGDASAGELARRARRDVEFVAWKIEFANDRALLGRSR